MKDLALDKDTHDLYFVDSSIQVVNDLDSVEQRLKTRLLFYLKEWFLDTTAGVPFYTDLLIKNPNIPDIENILKAKILDTPEVIELLEFDTVYAASARSLEVTFKVRATYGYIDLIVSLFN
jgi:hypothetical protein